MSGTTNFQQWNPAAGGQENDATYASDTVRSGGAPNGQPFAPSLANKLFYQITTFVTAFALAMVAKGYAPNDGTTPYTPQSSSNAAVLALQAILQNILTAADFTVSATMPGYLKLPSSLGGIVIQWAQGTVESPPAGNTDLDITTQTINWPIAFPNACFIAHVSTNIASANATDLWYQTTSWTTAHVNVMRSRSHNDAGRQGDYSANSQPFVIGIGN